MTNSTKRDLHVLIVGAGTSGLLVAQGLKKNGIAFTIFESETSTTYQTRPREWGMTLHWGASHIASCLPEDLAARFHEAYADPSLTPDAVTGLPIHNGKTGDLILEMGADQPVRVSRKKMRNLFSEGIDVQYGKQVVRAYVIEDSSSHDNGRVKIEFRDGDHAVGDNVVGTDGAKSLLRESIVGFEDAQLTTIPVNLFNFSYRFDPELSLRIREHNKIFINSIHPDHGTMYWLSIMDVPDPDKPETWSFQVMQSWNDNTTPPSVDLATNEGRLKFFKARCEEYAEPWRSVGRAVKDGTTIPMDRLTYWEKSKKWDNRGGRMTLCGDAAHPMTPHRGQGLNNALQDASNFVSIMVSVSKGSATLAEVVQAYDDEVLERGQTEMDISLKQSYFVHDWDKLMQSPMVKIGMHQVKKGEVEESA
ncbi:FAD/NAD(P)-binding domain-containing protein [Macroventuria anomochaeta]|uniref:FAD/NAD(P)-binding domain-containing protein n=1 Tax=Macroventuria anomochaeta TaxID=301207 RepID=A0ACB6RHE7_9PLEO|nr:FAD/NAD(P)-binding domain-containing protein [Macroventuria anomochaeta]KAF2621178.1 FAD/NAD(P)-binding domain-containing protein [Macroventuria anomochaeta]